MVPRQRLPPARPQRGRFHRALGLLRRPASPGPEDIARDAYRRNRLRTQRTHPQMLTLDQVAIAKGLLARGEKQHDIAAFLGCNGGRVAEIKTGAKHADVKPAAKKDLPTSADM